MATISFTIDFIAPNERVEPIRSKAVGIGHPREDIEPFLQGTGNFQAERRIDDRDSNGHYDRVSHDIFQNGPPSSPVYLHLGAVAGKRPYGKKILADYQETAQDRHAGEARFPKCIVSNGIGHVSDISMDAALEKSPAPALFDPKERAPPRYLQGARYR